MRASRLIRRSTLFVFNGPHGGGKSEVLRLAAGFGSEFDVALLRKLTTRPVRATEVGAECLDSVFVSPEEFARHCQRADFWTYSNGYQYGLDLRELRDLCAAHRNVACIVTNPTIIRQLPRACPTVIVVPVFVYADASLIARRLARVGSAAENTARTTRTVGVMEKYQADPFLYQHTILNVFDTATLEHHVRQLLQRYNNTDDEGRVAPKPRMKGMHQ